MSFQSRPDAFEPAQEEDEDEEEEEEEEEEGEVEEEEEEEVEEEEEGVKVRLDDASSALLAGSPWSMETMIAMVAVVRDRLYMAVVRNGTVPCASERVVYFTIDEELTYESFYYDHGPLNLAKVARYCKRVNDLLRKYERTGRQIVHYTSNDPKRILNAAFLVGCYAIVYQGQTGNSVMRLLSMVLRFTGGLKYCDASQYELRYLSLKDCLNGFMKAHQCNMFNFSDFNHIEYEYYERVENGDLNWIVPGKLLAFCGPQKETRYENGVVANGPDVYFDYFTRHNVTTVVRLNMKRYDARSFTDEGFQHYELFFPDGSNPDDDLLQQFLQICENATGAVAVHCKAGLGRTGTLIGAYLVKHYGMTAQEAIGWLRVCRPGSVIGPQQTWLRQKQALLQQEGASYRRNGRPAVPVRHPFGIYSRREAARLPDGATVAEAEATAAAEAEAEAAAAAMQGISQQVDTMRLSDDEDANERIAAANQYNNNTLHFKTTQYGRTNTYVLAKRSVVAASRGSGGDDGSADDGGGSGGGGGGGGTVGSGSGGGGEGVGCSTTTTTTSPSFSRIPPYQAGRASVRNAAAASTTTPTTTNSPTAVPTYRRRLSACVGATTPLGTQGDQLNLIKATRRRRITIVPTERHKLGATASKKLTPRIILQDCMTVPSLAKHLNEGETDALQSSSAETNTSRENGSIAIDEQTSEPVSSRETIIHLTSPAAPVTSEPSAELDGQPNVRTSPTAFRAALRTPLPARKPASGREETDGRTPQSNDAATDEQRAVSPNDALHPGGDGSPSSTVAAIECALHGDTSSEEVAGQQQQEANVHANNTSAGGRADAEPEPSSLRAAAGVVSEPNSPRQEPPSAAVATADGKGAAPATGSPPAAAPTPPPLTCDVNGNTRAPAGSPVVVVPRPMTRAMLRKQLHSDATRLNHRGAVNNENQRGNRGDINSNVIIDETKRFKRTRSGNANECQKTKEKVRKLGLSGLAKGAGVATKASAAPKAKVACDARTGKQRSVDGTGGCGVGGGTDAPATKAKVASIRTKR